MIVKAQVAVPPVVILRAWCNPWYSVMCISHQTPMSLPSEGVRCWLLVVVVALRALSAVDAPSYRPGSEPKRGSKMQEQAGKGSELTPMC